MSSLHFKMALCFVFVTCFLCQVKAQSIRVNSTKYTYTITIKNHLKVDANDIYFKTNGPENGRWANTGLKMISNGGSMLISNLWNEGYPIRSKRIWGQKYPKKVRNGVSFNLGDPASVKPGTIAQFQMSKYFFGKADQETSFTGEYWWTDGRKKRISKVMPINIKGDPNYYVKVKYITTPPRGANQSRAGCKLNNTDSVAYAMESFLKKKEELISIGVFEGVLAPGDSVEHEFIVEQGEDGDSIFAIWNYENMETTEAWMDEVSAEIDKSAILTPSDTLFWSKGEVDSSFVAFIGGDGVEVRSPEMPNFIVSDNSEDFVSYAYKYPEQFADQTLFDLTFIRTGRGNPSSTGMSSGETIDTAQCVVRHGDFRPTASWTFETGLFEPINDTVIFPVTVNRMVDDSDWIYTEIFGDNMTDTAWFHHQISSSSAQFIVPLGFLPGELDQIDSLYVVVTAALAPSSPDTLLAYFGQSQNVDHYLSDGQVDINVYPNPIKDISRFVFQLSKPEKILITVYNMKGQLLETLVNEELPSGKQVVEWDSSTQLPGQYFYIFQNGNRAQSGKMIILE
ncbi:MAG: T9SS type A sorting domain-containing protein [Bacteroidetes bacterium]|nr:T9SS type A sorting domain-containing protein [Bacteroidota bacterium]